jgi:hypothetical protein
MPKYEAWWNEPQIEEPKFRGANQLLQGGIVKNIIKKFIKADSTIITDGISLNMSLTNFDLGRRLCTPTAGYNCITSLIGNPFHLESVADIIRLVMPLHTKFVGPKPFDKGYYVFADTGNMFHRANIAVTKSFGLYSALVKSEINLDILKELTNNGTMYLTVDNLFILFVNNQKVKVEDGEILINYKAVNNYWKPFTHNTHVIQITGVDNANVTILDPFNLDKVNEARVIIISFEELKKYLIKSAHVVAFSTEPLPTNIEYYDDPNPPGVLESMKKSLER